ncbi:MAG: hypothetical protein M1831_005886 [Alyxoria varia]|nr:MAG: hypothetical protein M1831_005886 [Alyxoria varia]
MAQAANNTPSTTNQWILSQKPTALPVLDGTSPHQTFTLEQKPLPLPLQPGQLLLKTLYLSNDPAQRAWISANISAERLYTAPVAEGDVMRARCICEVVDSAVPADQQEVFGTGKHVLATSGWTEYSVMPAKECVPVAPLPGGLSETHYLGALGLTGLTAYYGLVEVVKAKPSDTVVVSGAAGATGSMAVQIAKRVLGCKRVVGIAGGSQKCKWVTESLGADTCVDYKAASFDEELKKATDGFVEVYFDNVGGSTLDTMLTRMAPFGRIAACGSISTYNDPSASVKNFFEITSNRLSVHGFIIIDFIAQPDRNVQGFGSMNQVLAVLREHIARGNLTLGGENETVVDTNELEEGQRGVNGIPKVWGRLFEGGNMGKLVTKVA